MGPPLQDTKHNYTRFFILKYKGIGINQEQIPIQSNPGIYKVPISNCLAKGDDETEKLPTISVHDFNWERHKNSD